jgi:tight adherence protein B
MNVGAALLMGTFVAFVTGALLGTLPHVRVVGPVRHRRRSRDAIVQQAGLGISASQLRVLSITAAAFTLLVLTGVTRSVLVAAVPAGAVALLPRHVVMRRARLRRRELQAAWPDGLRDLVASIGAGRSLTQAVGDLARYGPPPLRDALRGFPELARVLGTAAALEIVREELADPTSDRVLEILVLAHECGGPIVRTILADLVDATTRDLKVLDVIDTESLETRINARAVVVLPWLVLIALTARAGPFRDFYRSSGGIVTLVIAAGASALGILTLGRLGRDPEEPRVFGRTL